MDNVKSERGRTFFILIMAQLVLSASYLMAKVAVQEFHPWVLGFFRFVIAALLMAAWVKRSHPGIRIEPADRWNFFWMSLLVVPLNQGVFLYAIQYVPSAHGALFYATTPIMVLALSVLFLREPLTAPKLVGVILGFGGVLLVLSGQELRLDKRVWWGDLLLLVAVATWAIFTILNKKMTQKYPPAFITARCFLIGTLLFLPIGIPFAWGQEFSRVTWKGVSGLLYLALFTSVIGYWAWSWGLSRLEASRVAMLSNLQPVLAAGWGWMLLRETITLRFSIGALVIFGAVFLAEKEWNRRGRGNADR